MFDLVLLNSQASKKNIQFLFREIIVRSVEVLEAPGGFEPPVEILQTSALPLGDGAPI